MVRQRQGDAVQAIAAVREGDQLRAEELGEDYFDWMERTSSVCISRRSVGIRFRHGTAGRKLSLPKPRRKLSPGRSPITRKPPISDAQARTWRPIPTSDSVLTRDEDVLDNGFLGIVPFSARLAGRHVRIENVLSDLGLVTGFDIIFFWWPA